MEGDVKAYICMETYECQGGVVFAETNLAARKIASYEWNDGELGGLSVRRAPDLDKYYGKGVPAWDLIVNHGWRWDGCSCCGQPLDYDNLEDAGKDPTKVFGYDGGMVFCDQSCKDEYARCKEEKDRAGKAFMSAMIDRLKKRFGDIEIERTHHFTTMRDGHCTTEQAIVEFDFPGRKYGYAALRYSNDNYRPCEKLMPCSINLLCSNGDVDAFDAWAISVKPTAPIGQSQP
jgi:hypothetical protein